MWMLQRHSAWLDEPPRDPIVRLLLRFDTYLLGYQDRNFMLSKQHENLIHPGGGMIKSALIVDGRALGIWRSERRKSGTTIVIELFEAIAASVMPGLEAEVRDIARFLGENTHLRVGNL